MEKPRIFLGSSGKQAKLLAALTRGLEHLAHVEPWTTSFNPGTTTLERLLDGRDDQKRVELIAERLRHWKPMKST